MYVKKVLLALALAMVVLLGASVAFAASNNSSETTMGEDDKDESYKGSVSVAGKNEASLQKLATVEQDAAERVALEAVAGKLHETELETSDNGYVVYDIEIAGEDGKAHEVTVDAGNGKVLHHDLEEEADEPDGGGDTEEADDDGTDDTEDADDEASDREDAD